MTTGERAGGAIPVYTFGVRLDQPPSPDQTAALRQASAHDRWAPAGRGAMLRCERQAESLSAAIARAFEDIARVAGPAPLWVDIDLEELEALEGLATSPRTRGTRPPAQLAG